MKIKLLLLAGVGFVPSILLAQTAPYLYNKGIMSVVSTANVAPTATTLFVGGDFIAGKDATVASSVTLRNTRTVLTGNFYSGLNSTGTGVASATGQIFKSAVGETSSEFVFRKSTTTPVAQKITFASGSAYQQSLKGENYINFPKMIVDNDLHVTIDPGMAVSVPNLTLGKGRLILDSRRLVVADLETGYGGVHSPANSTVMAHFMVASTGTITTPNNATYVTSAPAVPGATYHNNFGSVQVNLLLDQASPTVQLNTSSMYGRSLIGMGSPYKSILSDYFFWNFLMLPVNESTIGGNSGNLGTQDMWGDGHTMTDPQRVLKAGAGFVAGIDLRSPENHDGSNNYINDLHSLYKAVSPVLRPQFANRATEGYKFSRFGDFFKNPNNVRKVSDGGGAFGALPLPADHIVTVQTAVTNAANTAYADEVLNYTDVTNLDITQGYNYYSNPYTVPLDLSAIVDANGGAATGWGVNAGAAGVAGRDVSTSVWILSPDARGSGTFNIDDPYTTDIAKIPGNRWIMVNAPYLVMRPAAVGGSTYDPGEGTGLPIPEGPDRYQIAPLQMFVLYAPAAPTKKLTIPASARKIGGNAYFLRSNQAVDVANDDFVFTVKDTKTLGADRTAIVIKTPQEVMSDVNNENIRKLVTEIKEDPNNLKKTRSVLAVGEVNQGASSILYTKSDQGAALESNILGVPLSAASESVPLYLTPSLVDQNIVISIGRTQTKKRVLQIMLKDKVANKEVDLLLSSTYPTTAKSTDPLDRFTLRFVFDTEGTTGIEDEGKSDSKTIASYYQNGTLTVSGFDDIDQGSLISVYDLQGRKVAQARVDDTVVEITQSFSAGAYIVKVVGNQSYVAKFLVR